VDALRREDSGDERTSLRLGAISEHRQIPNDPGPRMAGSDEKDAYVVAVPLKSAGARGTCEASAKRFGVRVGREAEGGYRGVGRSRRMRFWGMRAAVGAWVGAGRAGVPRRDPGLGPTALTHDKGLSCVIFAGVTSQVCAA
jgi:hypothetical protein